MVKTLTSGMYLTLILDVNHLAFYFYVHFWHFTLNSLVLLVGQWEGWYPADKNITSDQGFG